MNHPAKSKINYTAAITQIITIVLLMGFIPEKYTPHILALVGLVLPSLVQVFRTWHTEP